ncbi:MAG: protein kinase [Planctomycetes bacterium]|nr:protein kinase [Planctomycetota bacterium]
MQIDSGGQALPEVRTDPPSTRLKGRYVLVRTLPLAEPGTLYVGRDQRTGERLRIRAIPVADAPERTRAELHEACRRLMTLRRPDYFPRVRDLIESDGACYLVQEGTDGIPLSGFLREEAPSLPDRYRIVHLFRQIADRLSYLHDHIHGAILFRDLTPERVLVDPATRLVHLVDFSLPGIAAGPPQGTPRKGTSQSLAPELYRGVAPSVLTDVYALGRILQYLVFGETLDDPNPSTPIPTAVGRGVPDALRELVQRLIAPDPALRPETVRAAKQAFEACFEAASASFSLVRPPSRRDHCPSCGFEADADDLLCPHCGGPGLAATRRETAGGDLAPQVRVSGLERERFLGLRPVSLERFSLLRMSARTARLGGYESLLTAARRPACAADLPLVETLQVLRDLRGRALLVGPNPTALAAVGETLVAEYRARGWVNRVLVLVPGNLAATWQQRLRTRHGLEAEIYDPDGTVQLRALPDRTALLTSPESVRTRAQRQELLATTWDLVVVDAAHLCTLKGSHRWQLLESLRSKYLLLLTATPVQDDTSELLNLLRLVRPDLWNTSPQDFRAALDTTLPAMRDKIERTLLEIPPPARAPLVEATYLVAEPQGDAGELYQVILNSLASSDLDVKTALRIKRALISASPALLETAAEDDTAAALIAGVRTLLDGENHPKAYHLLHTVLPLLEGKAVLFSDDPQVRRRLVDLLARAGVVALAPVPDGAPAASPAWQRFAEDDQARLLLLGADTPGPLPPDLVRTAIFFDLPWEPARVADRIARLATGRNPGRSIRVLQLLAPGTVEGWLYDLYRDALQLYTPGTALLHAAQASMQEGETFVSLLEEVAAAAIPGGHGTSRAVHIQERLAGVRDHVLAAARRSEEILRLFRRESSQ